MEKQFSIADLSDETLQDELMVSHAYMMRYADRFDEGDRSRFNQDNIVEYGRQFSEAKREQMARRMANAAVRSQVETVTPEQYQNNKRKMRRC